jgi:hypothetical protein
VARIFAILVDNIFSWILSDNCVSSQMNSAKLIKVDIRGIPNKCITSGSVSIFDISMFDCLCVNILSICVEFIGKK